MYHLRKTSSQPHLLAPTEACEPGLTHQSTAHLNQTVLPRIDLNPTQASGQFWTSGTIEKIDTLAIILPAVYIYIASLKLQRVPPGKGLRRKGSQPRKRGQCCCYCFGYWIQPLYICFILF